jgi:hypothetical protein
MIGRTVCVAMLVALASGVAMGDHELWLYFSVSNDTSHVPPEWASQTTAEVAIGQPAYLWAKVLSPDIWIGITLEFAGSAGSVTAGQMYNPAFGGGVRWHSGSDFDPVGDNEIGLIALGVPSYGWGLGRSSDPLQAPGGHFLLGEIVLPYSGGVHLVNGLGGIGRQGGSGNELIYFGFGDDPIRAGDEGATTPLAELYVAGGPELGACCRADGDCLRITEAECLAIDGFWRGGGVSCDPNPCPVPGACCMPGGECHTLTIDECEQAGGDWYGTEVSCDSNPCPQPQGACCHTDGSCEFVEQVACESAGGDWAGASVPCDPNPCPQRGDLNCDRRVDNFDITPFVLALVSTPPDYRQYYGTYPDCHRELADINGDGRVDNFDISPFVQLLISH